MSGWHELLIVLGPSFLPSAAEVCRLQPHDDHVQPTSLCWHCQNDKHGFHLVKGPLSIERKNSKQTICGLESLKYFLSGPLQKNFTSLYRVETDTAQLCGVFTV